MAATTKTTEATKPAEETKPADLGQAEATTTTATSGATVEPRIVEELPMDHPAVDSKPREGLPPESSRIDFNDPSY
ncbi:hypothetical protein [Roseomonas xinghualingensis]|uniref:hypothetical protein n=1 Tax=Roseomonas xinghualingensis TaxID=2986475 RepID=UPI0021F23CF1|nr:hypothetical protein [Roseomonas sp. SXEYE001]MCV4209892.1 hypothetical protein [Roseomonas sp. SXEYE001]